MAFPERCEHDSSRSQTCFEEGLTAPVECAIGTLSVAPYSPALPAAPGYMQTTVREADTYKYTHQRRQLEQAAPALHPSLNTATSVLSNATTAVPASAIASTTALVEEEKTNFSVRVLAPCADNYYCNLGRSEEEGEDALLCPAYFFCPSSDVVEPTLCDQSGNCTSDACALMSSCPVRFDSLVIWSCSRIF